MASDDWPLGALITSHRGKMSMREAARRAGLSETWWRNIERGTQIVGGQHVRIQVKPETVATMARTVGADVSEALKLAGHDPGQYPHLLEGAAESGPAGEYQDWFKSLPREEREAVLAELQRVHVDVEVGRRRAG